MKSINMIFSNHPIQLACRVALEARSTLLMPPNNMRYHKIQHYYILIIKLFVDGGQLIPYMQANPGLAF